MYICVYVCIYIYICTYIYYHLYYYTFDEKESASARASRPHEQLACIRVG